MSERLSARSRVKVRPWNKGDIAGIIDCHRAAYSDFPPETVLNERIHEMQLNAFPEGQILAEVDGRVIGYATCLIVQLDDRGPDYTYYEITGGYSFNTHDPAGDTLYGADIAVHPDYRGMGVAGLLYRERLAIMRRYNLRRMVAYGRLPGYHQYSGKLTAEEYVEKVKHGEIKDSALSAHLKTGYRVRRVVADFLPDDSSMNYSTFLELENEDFDPNRRAIAASPLERPIRTIRICAAQWRMRQINDFEEFEAMVHFFADTAETYHGHFLLLPELFVAQLFTLFSHNLEPHQAIRRLADEHGRYIELFKTIAREHRLYTIAGSFPTRRGNELFNTAHLFTPEGNVYQQDKLHIPGGERKELGLVPGERLHLFDTPLARFGILMSYDIVFPELTRILAGAGAEVIFVPFSTDEENAYHRVRACAHARATENYLYVAMTGNVGNLPTIRNYLVNYSQAAVFTPSDFAFPRAGLAREAQAGEETVMFTDLDLGALRMQRDIGSVRPLLDRRSDLYRLSVEKRLRIFKTV